MMEGVNMGSVQASGSCQDHASNSTLHHNGAVGSVRQHHVSTVNLCGVDIVYLWMDGQERLCLAQISNTLLKEYSYNEIHNRRVALGITCVQCTPAQLEILRRMGAMPVSSRRCGMITKREAERLVKSFLAEANPPKLVTHFRFEVKHECGWGCRGQFIPGRYNSSRAKCVQCQYCNTFFSPNKFVFHFHRLPDSKYKHPDAANFNSWRRHLMLANGDTDTALLHAWEDVKAMFNGGSRRRILAAALSRSASKPHTALQRPARETDCNSTTPSNATRDADCEATSVYSRPRLIKPLFHKTVPPMAHPWMNLRGNEHAVPRTTGIFNSYRGMNYTCFKACPSYNIQVGEQFCTPPINLIPRLLSSQTLLNQLPVNTFEQHGRNFELEGNTSQLKLPNPDIFRPYALHCDTDRK